MTTAENLFTRRRGFDTSFSQKGKYKTKLRYTDSDKP